jgi:hypothetical protein
MKAIYPLVKLTKLTKPNDKDRSLPTIFLKTSFLKRKSERKTAGKDQWVGQFFFYLYKLFS